MNKQDQVSTRSFLTLTGFVQRDAGEIKNVKQRLNNIFSKHPMHLTMKTQHFANMLTAQLKEEEASYETALKNMKWLQLKEIERRINAIKNTLIKITEPLQPASGGKPVLQA